MTDAELAETVFIDDDGDICRSGGGDNLVALAATGGDEDQWKVLNPEVYRELVSRYNVHYALIQENERLREALISAGDMRDAADKVSQWFATEARQFEGSRIQALRTCINSYDQHMEPKP